jgi:hypothetical protein
MKNEDVFIITASRLSLSEKQLLLLKKLSKDIDNWEYLLQMAEIQKVATIMYYSLKKYELIEFLPLQVILQLKNIFYATVKSNLRLLQLVTTIADICDEKIVLLKGIDLVETLYPNIGVRSMGDIDILVETSNRSIIYDKINASLSDGKISAYSGLHMSWVKKNIESLKIRHLPPICLKNGVCEIHGHIFEHARYSRLNDKIWQSIIPYKQSRNIYRLNTNIMLLHLCVHFYHHADSVVLLRMLCDINELIIKYADTLDWGEIRRFCKNPSLRNEINTALTYTTLYFNTKVPQDFILVEKVTEDSRSLEALLTGIGITHKQRTSLDVFFTDLKLIKSVRDLVIYVYRIIIPEKEWVEAKYSGSVTKAGIHPYFNYWKRHFNSLVKLFHQKVM